MSFVLCVCQFVWLEVDVVWLDFAPFNDLDHFDQKINKSRALML